MNKIKIIMVEDNENDIQIFNDAVKRFEEEFSREFDCEICKTIKDAFVKLDSSYDGIVIDISLGDQADDGHDIIKKLLHRNARVPIAIHTGTPDGSVYNQPHIATYTKGDPDTLSSILSSFTDLYDTGLTRIMGNRGKIEKALNSVFIESIYPQMSVWIKHGEIDSQKTETALLRHILNNLLQLLSSDTEESFPDEFYLPALSDEILTGSIIREKTSGNYFVVLNPACDLVLRSPGNTRNTSHLLLVLIEEKKLVFDTGKKRKNIDSYLNNNKGNYHWSPRTEHFRGGFINFQQLKTLPFADLDAKYDRPDLQISPPFMKDVSARFSIYYGRQGQPDMQNSDRATTIKASLPIL